MAEIPMATGHMSVQWWFTGDSDTEPFTDDTNLSAMAGRFNIYSQLVILPIQTADINNSK